MELTFKDCLGLIFCQWSHCCCLDALGMDQQCSEDFS